MTTPTITSVADLEAHRFWLNIYNSEGAFKQLLIGYIENATNGLDRGFDGQMVNGGNVISLYAMQDAMKLSIQGRALPFNVTDVIPLGYKSAIASHYLILMVCLLHRLFIWKMHC
jgi:hypothetical protein